MFQFNLNGLRALFTLPLGAWAPRAKKRLGSHHMQPEGYRKHNPAGSKLARRCERRDNFRGH